MRRAGVCLDPRSLPSGAGIGEVRKAAMRWIDLLADLGLGLWRVPVLAAHDADGRPHSGLAFDASLHRGLAEDVEIDDEHITAWLSDEPWRVHHAVHATIAESEGEDWRDWPDAFRAEDGNLSVEVDANRVRYHAGLQLQMDIGWKMVLHHANMRQVILVLDVASETSPASVEGWTQQGEEAWPMRVATNARRAHVLALGEGMDATFVEGLPELPVGFVVHGDDPKGADLGRLRWSSQRDGEDETCFGLLAGASTEDLHALLEGPARWVAPSFHDLAPPGLNPFDADVLMPYAIAAHERGR
ncbi:MAG: 4-alpha-glucanotransferase [Candidatus Thermoplasmatota archaeon]|nr:4-alpha-glucanotransferase [Candidatus Thermoplasmatota archaeon]